MRYLHSRRRSVHCESRIVPNARKMNTINFEEMLELSSLGAKVLHTKFVQLALQYGVKLQVYQVLLKERNYAS